MARPIWSGTLSFGLLNIPVSLMPGERRTHLSLRMLDARNNAPVRYERVNAETGNEVPWKDVVKAFEYDKGSYVVLQPDDIRSAAKESHHAIEVESLVDATAIGPQYFEKPYVLVPAKKAEKGYVLLREALARTGKIGIARVVIRTRESLCAVMPQGHALLLLMMRYPQELVDVDEYALPEGADVGDQIPPQRISSPDKLIYPADGITKQQVANYYRTVAPRLLQEVVRRPLSLLRCPMASRAWCFFQKHHAGTLGAHVHAVAIGEKRGASSGYLWEPVKTSFLLVIPAKAGTQCLFFQQLSVAVYSAPPKYSASPPSRE